MQYIFNYAVYFYTFVTI